MAKAWDYEGYWNVTIGANRSASMVAAEFDLVEEGLDEWLSRAESEAWQAGGQGGDIPAEWADFHDQALAELQEAIGEEKAE
jgi:hypothetical protein